jgi:hypothetical protein
VDLSLLRLAPHDVVVCDAGLSPSATSREHAATSVLASAGSASRMPPVTVVNDGVVLADDLDLLG